MHQAQAVAAAAAAVAAGRRAKLSAAESYPTSEVRDSCPECQAATAQERPGGATQARGQGRRPGGATRGAVAEQAQEGLEELSHVEGQEGRQ